MSKNIVPYFIVIFVIFLGIGGIFFLSNQSSTPLNQNPNDLIPTLFPSSHVSPTASPQQPAIISEKPQNTNSSSGANMDNFITTQDGLKYLDEVVGTGDEVKSGDTVTVHYLGTLENGVKFDSSYDRNAPFTTQIGVGHVIKGWDEGIVGMKTGGKRKLVIPSDLGYGNQSAGSIPPNSTLVFEVELLKITK